MLEFQLVRKKCKPKRCIHYWVIEMSTYPAAQGLCRLCGAKREFINVIEDRRDLNGDLHSYIMEYPD